MNIHNEIYKEYLDKGKLTKDRKDYFSKIERGEMILVTAKDRLTMLKLKRDRLGKSDNNK